jgi:alanine-glyoxylate transaminase / (R)-3-amino-2-methylpropionate-pyruvate transaminase
MHKNIYFHFYKDPLFIVEGKDQYLFDHKGNRYLDLIAGISTVSIGHSHPAITKVITEQAGRLMHTTPIYLTEYQGEYSKALCDELGPEYDQVFLCNSGSEANDMALLLARMYTGQNKLFSLRNGYHGLVGNSKSVTNVSTWNTHFNNTNEFERLAWPSQYRGSIKDVNILLKDAEEAFQANAIHGKIAGMIFEPIQGVGGINPAPAGYGKGISELVRKYGGLVISDEVQTGFGRVG